MYWRPNCYYNLHEIVRFLQCIYFEVYLPWNVFKIVLSFGLQKMVTKFKNRGSSVKRILLHDSIALKFKLPENAMSNFNNKKSMFFLSCLKIHIDVILINCLNQFFTKYVRPSTENDVHTWKKTKLSKIFVHYIGLHSH